MLNFKSLSMAEKGIKSMVYIVFNSVPNCTCASTAELKQG